MRQRVFGAVERVPGMTRVKAAVREPIARHELRHFHDVTLDFGRKQVIFTPALPGERLMRSASG